jgi:hypothetical protein
VYAALVPREPLKADINCDGEVDVLDVVLCTNIILLLLDPTEYQEWAADCNEDGEIDILDTVCIVNIILGGGKNVVWDHDIEPAEVRFGQNTEMTLAKGSRCVLPIYINSVVPIAGVQMEILFGSKAVVPSTHSRCANGDSVWIKSSGTR